ncbi:MAG TPA: UMP kinase [Candidatus Saccharimonadales bacterium]|nr:UMP kinase [Candidatus Saccharimonadales bacterium]
MYKRVLLKISGEQLGGDEPTGVDIAIAHYIAEECKKVTQAGCQLVLIVGGGNMVRGAVLGAGESGIKRVTADQMGMLSGLMNGMALTDIFESKGIKTRCMSNIYATQLVESYSFRLAEKHLEGGRIVIIAGGLGRPFFTHDTAAVNMGLELGCELVMKATKVDGIYDKDPAKFPDATKIDHLTYQEAVGNEHIKVMDKAAFGLAMEQNIPVLVFDALQEGNILRAIQGEQVGTIVSSAAN